MKHVRFELNVIGGKNEQVCENTRATAAMDRMCGLIVPRLNHPPLSACPCFSLSVRLRAFLWLSLSLYVCVSISVSFCLCFSLAVSLSLCLVCVSVCRGRDVCKRAMGVIMFIMLVGFHPFDLEGDTSDADILGRVASVEARTCVVFVCARHMYARTYKHFLKSVRENIVCFCQRQLSLRRFDTRLFVFVLQHILWLVVE